MVYFSLLAMDTLLVNIILCLPTSSDREYLLFKVNTEYYLPDEECLVLPNKKKN